LVSHRFVSLGRRNASTVPARSLALTSEEYQRQRIRPGERRRQPPRQRVGESGAFYHIASGNSMDE
jgi:hypothetical protein